MKPWRGTHDPTKMTAKQRAFYFRRPQPSSLTHPYLQNLKSHAEMHQEELRQQAEEERMRGRMAPGDWDTE